jgi:TRAP-type C4-dicarboxylate transport system permease small subunit
MSAIQRGWLAWTRFLWALTRAFSWVSGLAILSAIVITLREVIGRYWFDAPTSYAYSWVSVSVVIILYFSLAYTATVDGHISSDEFYSKFPLRVQSSILLVGDILAAVIGWLLASQTWSHMRRSLNTNETIPDLFNLPLAVPQGFVVLGSFLLALVAVTKLPYYIAEIIRNEKLVPVSHDLDGDEQ